MSIENVTELTPGDIDRGGTSASTQQQPAFQIDGGEPVAETMGEPQQAALKEVMRLRGEYANTPAEKRDGLMKQMSALQRFAFGIGQKPADFMPAEAPPPDMRPYDGVADSLSAAMVPMTPRDQERLVIHGKVQGLSSELATEAATFCNQLGLDAGMSRAITDRWARHHAEGWGVGPLSQEEKRELYGETVKLFGSVEAATEASELAQVFLEKAGLGDWAEKRAGSLAFDVHLIRLLAFRAKVAGLKVS